MRFRRRRPRALDGLIGLLALVSALLAALVPSSSGAFTARVTNSVDTLTSATYFTCTAAAVAGGAFFTYPMDDTVTTLAARDVSGNNRTGGYLGLPAHSASSPCVRDGGGSTTYNGSSQYFATPSQLNNPQVFTIEIWFRTSVAGGLLAGFNNAQTGLGATYDRHLYLTNNGNVVFGVYPNTVVTVVSPLDYDNGAWHHAAATLSSAGMRLYVDGVLVGSNANTTAQSYTGYWRAAYGNLNSWTSQPSNFYFTGQLGYFSYYQTALSATAIQAHYLAGR